MFELLTMHLSMGTDGEAEDGVRCWWPQLVPEEVVKHLKAQLELVGLFPVVLGGRSDPVYGLGDDGGEVVCACGVLPEHRVVQGVLRG